LPPIEPVNEPSLPPIDYQPPADPAPVRTLSPRIGDKLFSQSAPPAVAALESDIEVQFKARRYGDAAAQIDRALRIQPKNAELWHVLAEIRLRQNQHGLAEDLAKKSNSLAKSNPELVKSNWRIIADARRQQGNGAGAQDALEKAW
jgi:predicted Zn-dependent protease